MSKTNQVSNEKADATAEQPRKRERASVESTFAEKWTPEVKGDMVEGIYMGYEEAPGRGGDTFQAYQLLQDDGKRISLAGAHLDSLLPQVPKGSYVWVTYDGLRPMKNNNKMQLFKLEVEKGVKLLEVLK